MLKSFGMFTALAVSTSLWAATPINERRPLDANGQVRVDNLAGRVDVSAWDRPEVEIQGQLGVDVEQLEIDGGGSSLSVRVRYPKKVKGGVQETLLQLRVPREATVDLSTVSADLMVRDVAGAITAGAVSGDIVVRSPAQKLRINTVSGDVSVRGAANDAELNSVSGDIEASGLSGRIKAGTVSGDLDVQGADFTSIAAETVSGDMTLVLTLAPAASLKAEALSGNIEARIGALTDARIQLETFSGRLRGSYAQGTETAAKRRKVEQTLGDGATRIALTSFSGDITLDR